MIRGIDNGKMVTDLDAAFFIIRNLGAITPPPPNLITEDDPRLSDARNMVPGSVTDDSIADDAAISQFKFSFHDNALPPAWLGTDDTHAAQGDLVQYASDRDQINGYPSLDVNGKLLTGTTPTAGTGTLHTIDIQMPLGEVTTLQDTTGTNIVSTGYWNAQDPETWFGNFTGGAAVPTFKNNIFPVDLIPNFDASKITSEVFTIDQVPMAVGVGASHSAGLLPDPGSTDTDSSAQPDDYLSRGMDYLPMKPVVSIQPTLPPPSITVQSTKADQVYVNITSGVAGTTLFYRTSGDVFTEITSLMLPLVLTVGTIVSAYAAKIGYNNSNIATYTVVPPGV